jgi:parallel beta-helix repeat protein
MVRNCSVHDGSFRNPGIYLQNCVNGTLENNNCSNDLAAIILDSSRNNTLINNTCGSNVGTYDIQLTSSNHNMLISNTCNSNYGECIFLDSSSGNVISNNTCSSNGDLGIYLISSSNNNEISRNLVCNNAGSGVGIGSGSGNCVWNNTFVDNHGATDTYNKSHAQAYDDGTNNWWNSTGGYGNYWSDWTTPDAVPPWGMVDHPYNMSGSAAARDNYPLTRPPVPIP